MCTYAYHLYNMQVYIVYLQHYIRTGFIAVLIKYLGDCVINDTFSYYTVGEST